MSDLERDVAFLEASFTQLMDRAEEPPVKRVTSRTVDASWVVFWAGEVLVFDAAAGSPVDALNMLGIPDDSYTLQTSGERLFFTRGEGDFGGGYSPRLTMADLPYGFAGSGSFQFSSTTVATIEASTEPAYVFVNLPLVYGVPKGSLPTYAQALNDTVGLYHPYIAGYPWYFANPDPPFTMSADAARAYVESGSAVSQRFQHQTGVNCVKYTTCQPTDVAMLKRTNGGQVPIWGPNWVTGPWMISGGLRSPLSIVGWRPSVWFNGHENFISLPVDLLAMPKDQLEQFDVNPEPQQPYAGGEGVYPVVLVEFLRDVFVPAPVN